MSGYEVNTLDELDSDHKNKHRSKN